MNLGDPGFIRRNFVNAGSAVLAILDAQEIIEGIVQGLIFFRLGQASTL